MRMARTYVKVIMTNPESSKIFYFLLLNLAFMFVQMLYGVWTNSLGLISDGKWMILLWDYLTYVKYKPSIWPSIVWLLEWDLLPPSWRPGHQMNNLLMGVSEIVHHKFRAHSGTQIRSN
jgi:hypothetical protein